MRIEMKILKGGCCMTKKAIAMALAVVMALGLGLFGKALADPLFDVEITPVNPPIEFGYWGGWFQFQTLIVNNSDQPETIDAWAMLRFPSGLYYGPINGHRFENVGPHETLTCNFVDQRIPGCLEYGVYTYYIMVGRWVYQNPTAYDSSSLNFSMVFVQSANDGDCGGTFDFRSCVEPDANLSDIGYDIKQNYPNPFNARTTITYQVPNAGNVRLDIYDILGRKVRTLVDGFNLIGPHQVSWDALNDNGGTVSTGIYFYRLVGNGYAETKRMTLVK
ncbi:MAG: hypothetical protein CO189_03765 [candidate division Zixibacteria bacterium CG_4_9_14_3_um_filter_46_8]|nr:MAG: hypothetical protein CO189_03765 [candidate division Zixibacteria bacterium CG_4_9_14_3_um_filter_46_8]